jgi:hypothetical protein
MEEYIKIMYIWLINPTQVSKNNKFQKHFQLVEKRKNDDERKMMMNANAPANCPFMRLPMLDGSIIGFEFIVASRSVDFTDWRVSGKSKAH